MLRLFNTYYPARHLLFFLGESVLIIGVIWLVILALHSGEMPHNPERASVWLRILFIVLLLQMSLYYLDLYQFRLKSGAFELSLRIIQAIGLACLVLAAAYYLFPRLVLDEGFFYWLFLLILLLVSWRIVYQYICQKRIWNEKMVLVGEGELAELIGEEITSNLDSGHTISAVFSNPGRSSLAERLGVEKQTNYDKLCEYAIDGGISKIVVALEERRGHYPIQALLNCKMQGLKVLEGFSFYETLSGKIVVRKTPPSWLIFSRGFRRYTLTLWAKRGADIFLASVGLVLSGPFFATVPVLIKLDSPGPVFFRQSRVGQRENNFQLIKFRTMRQDAEAESGAVWAEENDPRITFLGRLLRKFRLDELPQFWNVLKGEMSFVGPRPERPEFVEQLKRRLPYYGERHTVKPGITGWAQVNYGYGASEEDALHKLEYDLFYIKYLSLVFDLYTVLKTAKIVLVGGGGAR